MSHPLLFIPLLFHHKILHCLYNLPVLLPRNPHCQWCQQEPRPLNPLSPVNPQVFQQAPQQELQVFPFNQQIHPQMSPPYQFNHPVRHLVNLHCQPSLQADQLLDPLTLQPSTHTNHSIWGATIMGQKSLTCLLVPQVTHSFHKHALTIAESVATHLQVCMMAAGVPVATIMGPMAQHFLATHNAMKTVG